ncbi:hypothetical protein Syun_013618 [Stephania yunnanensis]|uniref:Protein LNK1 n=1 Tax=Stephania yunnanensis TaxID=152371 RepID=A0AAP0P7X1_9MAGN
MQANGVSGELEVKISPAQTFSGNNGPGKLQRKQSKHPHQSDGKRKDRSLEYAIDRSFHGVGKTKQTQKLPNSSSVKQVTHSPDGVQQNNSVQSDSVGYLGTFNPYVNVNYNRPALQTPVTQTISCNKSGDNSSTSLTSKTSFAANHAMPSERSSVHLLSVLPKNSEQKMEKLCGQHQVQSDGNIFPQHGGSVVHDACAEHILFQKQRNQSLDEFTGHNAADGEGIETPAEVDSSIAQESSCMSSVLSDDFSLEANSFRQLQHVMQKLDIRTKLCIRDSLYRLARNAEQRHNNLRKLDCSSRDNSGLHTTDDLNESAGFLDFETNTNPIDRSIAHLLFHGPSDPCTRPANDVLSLESRTIIQGSTTGQPVMPEKLVHEEESASGDSKLPVSD